MENNKNTNKESLTPKQAADVVKYYSSSENERSRQRGWKDKIPLGQSALHAMSLKHSVSPDGKALLTAEEMAAALKYMDNPPALELSDEQLAMIERIVDTRGVSYGEARRIAGL